MTMERKVTFHSAASATATGTVMNTNQTASVLVQITGTFVATVTFQGTVDGSNWIAIQATNINDGSIATTATAAGLYLMPAMGLRKFRANMVWTSGTSITATGISTTLDAIGSGVSSKPFSVMLEGGLTELVGINDEVNTNDYGDSVGVALGGTYSGEILSFAFYATEDGSGAVQDSAGVLYILDADPAISAGDTSMTAVEWVTVLGKVIISASDWNTDANGGCAFVYDQPVPFHALATLYLVWFHTDATDLNDAGGDDEQLEVNFLYRRDS